MLDESFSLLNEQSGSAFQRTGNSFPSVPRQQHVLQVARFGGQRVGAINLTIKTDSTTEGEQNENDVTYAHRAVRPQTLPGTMDAGAK